MNTKRSWTMALLVIAGMLIAGCGGPTGQATRGQATTGQAQEIIIGVDFPMTGGLAVYGEPLLEGLRLGVEEVNTAGGFDGARIRLVVEDNGGNPGQAASAAQKLISQEGTHVLLSTMVGPTGAIAPIADQEQVPMLYAAATDKFAEEHIWVFKDSVDAYYDCQELLKEAQRRGFRRIALVGSIAEFTDICRQALDKSDIILVKAEEYARGEKDYRTQLIKIMAAEPDAIILSAYSDECPQLWRQSRELGMDDVAYLLPFTQTGCGEARAMEEVRDWDAEIIGLDFVVDYKSAEYQEFITGFREKYGKEPSLPFFTMLAYDWAHYLVQAFERCDDPADSTCVKAALEQVEYTGAMGPVSFKPSHATFRPRVPIEYRENGWTLVSK